MWENYLVKNLGRENFDEIFPIIDLAKISEHRILQHNPKTVNQQRLMNDILEGIRLKLPAFRAPCVEPSVEDGKIVFKMGSKPAIGYSPD